MAFSILSICFGNTRLGYLFLCNLAYAPVSTSLTLSRLSFCIRHLSRILYLAPTVRRVPKYRHHRDLRHGPHVPFFTNRLRSAHMVSQFTTPVHFDRTNHYVSCFGAELVELHSSASDSQPGSLLRDWRRIMLQSNDCVHG